MDTDEMITSLIDTLKESYTFETIEITQSKEMDSTALKPVSIDVELKLILK